MVRFTAGVRGFYLLLWVLPSLLIKGYQRLFPCRYSGQCVKLTSHLQLVPRLRMHRAIPSLSPYAFMACAGTHLLFFQSIFCFNNWDFVWGVWEEPRRNSGEVSDSLATNSALFHLTVSGCHIRLFIWKASVRISTPRQVSMTCFVFLHFLEAHLRDVIWKKATNVPVLPAG